MILSAINASILPATIGVAGAVGVAAGAGSAGVGSGAGVAPCRVARHCADSGLLSAKPCQLPSIGLYFLYVGTISDAADSR